MTTTSHVWELTLIDEVTLTQYRRFHTFTLRSEQVTQSCFNV